VNMHVSRNRGNGRIARVVRKRLAPVAVAALMLGIVGAGIGAPQARAGDIIAIAVAQDGQQATSDFEPNGDATTIVLEDAVDSDFPPGPGIIAVL
jgi:hypothetical protein